MWKSVVGQDKSYFVSLYFENLFLIIIKSQCIIKSLKHLKKRDVVKKLAKLNEELKSYLKVEWKKKIESIIIIKKKKQKDDKQFKNRIKVVKKLFVIVKVILIDTNIKNIS